jgi:hypothetical protein
LAVVPHEKFPDATLVALLGAFEALYVVSYSIFVLFLV